jgi:thiol-disulfide isomerase/thioredoxin
MPKSNKISFYIVVAILSLAAGFAYKSRQMDNSMAMTTSEKKAGADNFFAATLPNPEGLPQSASQWQGKIVIVNFWATWCLPCREEIPELIETYTTYRDQGLVIVGVAIDEAEKVAEFSEEFGINYPILVGDFEAFSLAEAMGNPQGALPFTVTIDRSGMIVNSRLGQIKKKQIEEIIKPML